MIEIREMFVGTKEYLDVPITASVMLNAQPVQIRIGPNGAWMDADWQGNPDYTRTASVLLGGSNVLPPVGLYKVFALVTDLTEIPIFEVGTLKVSQG